MTAQPIAPQPVRVHAGQLLVQHWSCSDPTVVTAVERALDAGYDPGEYLAAALRVGVASLDSSRSSREVEVVGAGLTELGSTVTASVEQVLTRLDDRLAATVGSGGPLEVAVTRGIDRLACGIRDLMQPGAMVPNALQGSVRQVTDQVQRELQASLQSTTTALQSALLTDRQALAAQVGSIVDERIEGVRKAVEAIQIAQVASQAKAAERRKASVAGLDYEHAVLADLSDVLARSGTAVLAKVGGVPGEGGGKDGDGVATFVDIQARAAWECKRRNRPIDADAWAKLLASARADRNAVVACGVTPQAHMPGTDPVVMLSPADLLIAYDPETDPPWILACANQLLRFAAAAAQRPAGTGLEPEQIANRLRQLLNDFLPLVDIAKQAASIARTGEKVNLNALALKATLTQRVSDLIGEITPAPPPAAP